MKKFFYLPLIFISYSAFSQCSYPDPTDVTIYPRGIIFDGSSRIEIYRKHKNVPFPGSSQKANIDSILYSPCGFLTLLRALAQSTKAYTGLRIYFAANTNDKNKLILIFVPTLKGTDSQGQIINEDDLTACYQIVGNGISILSVPDASKYVTAYQNNQMVDFNKNGQYHHDNDHRPHPNKFEETKSLWYDISQINANTDPANQETGLIIYLQYLINKNNIDNVVANFAGFQPAGPDAKYNYQLDLVFNFYKKGTPYRPFLVAPKFHMGIALHNKHLAGDDADTGVPCPPPPSGSTTCPGALLPQDN